MKYFSQPSLALLLTLLFSASVHAHDLGAECHLLGEQIEVSSYFDNNSPAGHAQVTVLTPSGATVTQGKADAEGRWRFPIPAVGQYVVQVDAGGGHRVRVRINVPPPEQRTSTSLGKAEMASEHSHDTISEGPSRARFTTFPWERLALGLLILALLVGVLVWWVRRSQRQEA